MHWSRSHLQGGRVSLARRACLARRSRSLHLAAFGCGKGATFLPVAPIRGTERQGASALPASLVKVAGSARLDFATESQLWKASNDLPSQLLLFVR